MTRWLESIGGAVIVGAIVLLALLWLDHRRAEAPRRQVVTATPTERMQSAPVVRVDLPPVAAPRFTDRQLRDLAERFGLSNLATVEDFEAALAALSATEIDDPVDESDADHRVEDDSGGSQGVPVLRLPLAELEFSQPAPRGAALLVTMDTAGSTAVEVDPFPVPFIEADWRRLVGEALWGPAALSVDDDQRLMAALKWQPLRVGRCHLQAAAVYDDHALDLAGLTPELASVAAEIADADVRAMVGAECKLLGRW